MKKILAIAACASLCAGLLLTLTACGRGSGLDKLNLVSEYTRDLEGAELNVCNWGEYISDGSEGSLDVVAAFRELTGIKVNYSYFDTNEGLYAKLTGGGANYDLVIPSDYLIERLIHEDRLEPLDYANIPNYKYILEEYRDLYFDPGGMYSVPYTVGTTGLIYNAALVEEAPDSWGALWDARYKGQILQFNSPRDAFGTAQFLLGQDVNTHSQADWQAAADKLKEQAPLVQAYVADEIYNILEAGNAILGPYYAGDYLMMKENNEDLAFVLPKEGVNFFYDSACIPKGARNKAAAELFINFLNEPDVALANAEMIMYATPHAAVRENPKYSLRSEPVLYPETLPPTQHYENLPRNIRDLMSALWTEVKQVKGS